MQEYEYHSYKIRLQYLSAYGEKFTDTKNWYRTFSVPDSISLEGIHSIIQEILGWDGRHLFSFRINDKHYAFSGNDFPIILEPLKIKYFSCDIKIKVLDIKIDEPFFYEYDVGTEHRFSLYVEQIDKSTTRKRQRLRLSYLISYSGNNLKQYPNTLSNKFFDYQKESPPSIFFKQIMYTDYEKRYKGKIRFIEQDDYEILEKWRRGNDKKKWERSVAILENFNMSFDEISQKVERPIDAIKKWLSIFNGHGLDGLNNSLKGKKRKLPDKVKEKTKRILKTFHHKPSEYNINRSNWTLASLGKVYENQFGERISPSSVGRHLKNSGYSIKKAKSVLTSPDPDYREKVEELLKVLRSLTDAEEFFFVDELGPLRVKKYGGRCFVKKGESLITPQNQKPKGSITLSAALSAKTNQVTWLYEKSKDSSSMINLIESLFNQYHNKLKLFITWDAASWHSSNELLEWLDEFNHETAKIQHGPYIELIPLPSCSQFLNVIEAVFSGMKRAVIHHSNYQSETEMKRAISLHFQERNEFFLDNPKRAGKKIWEIDFFKDRENIQSGNYREY